VAQRDPALSRAGAGPGYYEWNQASQPKQPDCTSLPDESLTCFAGLWSSWRDIASFTILVGPAVAHLCISTIACR
jgi:putative SOS response-associated peptidase YedK